jgi:hypothetical protein
VSYAEAEWPAQVEHHTVVKLKKRGENTKFIAQVLAIGAVAIHPALPLLLLSDT